MGTRVIVTCGGREFDNREFDDLRQVSRVLAGWANRDATVKVEHPDGSVDWRTSDGFVISDGLRVFVTDWEWGTVDTAATLSLNSPWFDGWFSVLLDSGGHNIYNGERMSTRKP